MVLKSWKVQLAAACLSVALTGAAHLAYAQTASSPLKPVAAEWTTSGDGVAESGVYKFVAPTKRGQKPTPYKVTLGEVKDSSYIVTGKVLLPASTGVTFTFGAPVPPAPKPAADAPADAVAPPQPPAPPAPFGLSRMPTGNNLRIVRTEVPGNDPAEPLPIRIIVRPTQIEITIGSVTQIRNRTEAPLELAISITGAAVLSDLKVEGIDFGSFMPVMPLESRVNTAIDGTSAPVGKFAAGAVGKGFIESQGVTFHVAPEGAVDVAKSMSNVRGPFRNKGGFFNKASTTQNGRVVVDIPGDQYGALHLLAFSQGREGHVPRTTVRVGFYGSMNGILEDIIVNVPGLKANETNSNVLATIPVKLSDGSMGTLYHLRVPMAKTGNVKEFGTLDLEFTRDMNTQVRPPDPNEFGKIAVGSPSDVVVLAATLEPSPVVMSYVTAEPGNVFHDTQKPAFTVTLTNRSDKPQKARAYVDSAGPGTGEEFGIEKKAWTVEQTVDLKPGESKTVTLDVTPGMRGWFTAKVAVDVDGKTVQQRDTTFAVLAPDTRKATTDSPFGVWEFWHAHSVRPRPDQVEILGSLMNKGGWRYTYGGGPRMAKDPQGNEIPDIYVYLRDKYKINFNINNLPGAHNYQRGEGWFDQEEFDKATPQALARQRELGQDSVKVLHEARSSLNLLRRFSEFLGGAPYDMPAAEKEKLDKQFANVVKYTRAVKKVDPNMKIVLINDYPVVATEYMKRGMPKDAFDAIGLEGAMFSRQPERQPDWLTLLGNTHEIKRSMKKYGYEDKELWTTEALYHATEAGALTIHEQAVIAVREAIMALQLGYDRMAAAGLIKDPASDYHWSNWGSGGYCYRDPEINPKPVYAAYAWLTQVLDQAKPVGNLKTPNYSLHLVEFKKPDGSLVYSLWTAGGVQEVTLAREGNLKAWDFYGNPITIASSGPLVIKASPTPIYFTEGKISSVIKSTPVEILDTNTGVKLFDFDKAADFVEVKEPNKILDSSWDTPRMKGNFATEFVTEDNASAIKISLKPDSDDRKILPRYVEYKLAKPIKLEGRPHEFVFRVKGNSAWSRVMFEMTDAAGRVWTSCGNQYAGASNAADPHCESMVKFQGWHTMRFPIVGMYPLVDQEMYWPKNYNWWAYPSPEADTIIPANNKANEVKFKQDMAAYQVAKAEYDTAKAEYDKLMVPWTKLNETNPNEARKTKPVEPKEPVQPKQRKEQYMGLAPVTYPLTLTKIIVSSRPNILYLNDEVPIANQSIFIDNLGYTQPPDGQ